MTENKQDIENEFAPIAAEIIDVDLDDMVQSDFAEYSFYVIEDRALPDSRDGLKPVQRKTLYTAYADGYFPHKATVKSARIVGSCMSQYSPHGDASIYDAMVRIAQPHASYLPLFEGLGNFGAPGRPAAASRYTEARLSPYGYDFAIELKDKVVPMQPNFDETTLEPEVLPVKVPLLLINGSTGIAVAMATNMAPHNPREAVQAAIYLLENQQAWRGLRDAKTVEERQEKMGNLVDNLMRIIPGPDMPTGGVIMGTDGIRDAYMTGQGKFVIRGKYEIEQLPRGRKNIVFSELPYGQSPSGILNAVVEAEQDFIGSLRAIREWESMGKKGREPKIEGYKLEGVTGISNLSGKENPCKLVFELDAKTNPDAVLAELFKRTNLEVSFSINNNCLVQGVPQVLSLPEILQQFISFRRGIVRKRFENEKSSNAERVHILKGLKSVLMDIDTAIAIIRGAETQAKARDGLMEHFGIDEKQSKYVTDMRLGRLTRYETLELNQELESLENRVAELEELITSREKVDEVVRSELSEVLHKMENEESDRLLKKYPTRRRSEILDVSLKEYKASTKALQSASVEVQDEEVTLYFNQEGKVTGNPKEGWLLKVPTSTLGHYYAITDSGFAIKVSAVDTPEGYGIPGVGSDEKVVALVSGQHNIVLGTASGVLHFFNPNFPSNESRFPVAKLSGGDKLVGGGEVSGSGDDHFVFISSDSNLLHYSEEKVRSRQSINTQGVAGIKLAEGSEVIMFDVVCGADIGEAQVVTYTGEGGSVKSTPLSEFPVKGRGTGGVRSHLFRKGEEELSRALVDKNPILFVKGTRQAALASQFAGKRSSSGTKVSAPLEIFKNS